MASTINADDGVVSGSAGVKTSADNSGVLELQSNGTTQFTLGSSSVVINEAGADVDFRVEGDTDPNLIFADASTENVGFGTNAPEYKTDTVGSTRVAETAAQNGYEVAPGSTNILTSYNRTTSTWLPLRQRANQHEFYCDGVEAVRLNSSGNLGVGTNSPQYRLHVSDSAFPCIGAYRALDVGSVGAAAQRIEIGALDGSTPTPGAAITGVLNDPATDGYLTFETRSSSTLSERVRITAAGNLGLGTSSPAVRVDVQKSDGSGRQDLMRILAGGNSSGNGATLALGSTQTQAGYVSGLQTASNEGALVFGTQSSGAYAERARITSGGDLLVGTTSNLVISGVASASGFLSPDSEWVVGVRNTNATAPWGIAVQYSNLSPNNTSQNFIWCTDSTVQRFSVRSNGGIANYQGNDANLSDERVKTDIAPLGSMWDKFKAIEIVTFKYKDQTHDDNNIGVIAQQVESVAPEFVDVDGFGEMPEDGVPLKTVYTTDLYHAAIKALQEAMTRIEELEAKVAALESK